MRAFEAPCTNSTLTFSREWGGEIRNFVGIHPGMVEALAFHADGNRLASGGGFTIVVWDPAGGQRLQTLGGASRFPTFWIASFLQSRVSHRRWISAVAFSPDGKWLASAGRDPARLWSVETGKTIHIFNPRQPEP
ncbi:MAG: WD40 repeat domain-containing protein [Gammaproteobacteria bacterium]